MASNRLGEIFSITSYGESHGPEVGVVIDGCAAGIEIDYDYIQKNLNQRKPGASSFASPRKEDDIFEIVSGVFEGKTTGAPICIRILNQNQNPKDYANLKDVFRPSHADFTYQTKYGIRDHRGGGRSSARITAGWVAAGAIAALMLQKYKIEVITYIKQIYKHRIPDNLSVEQLRLNNNPLRCPDETTYQKISSEIENAIQQKDSLGGIVACTILNCPIGLGEPLFSKFQSKLAQAIFSLNAVKGLQMGGGFEMSALKGSEVNDVWIEENGKLTTQTNYSGGLQGGISNGMPVLFEVAFKPTASIGKTQETLNQNLEKISLTIEGRHDPCVVPRAVPIVSALTYLVLADLVCMANAGQTLKL
jgi:chorismate synthase